MFRSLIQLLGPFAAARAGFATKKVCSGRPLLQVQRFKILHVGGGSLTSGKPSVCKSVRLRSELAPSADSGVFNQLTWEVFFNEDDEGMNQRWAGISSDGPRWVLDLDEKAGQVVQETKLPK